MGGNRREWEGTNDIIKLNLGSEGKPMKVEDEEKMDQHKKEIIKEVVVRKEDTSSFRDMG